MINKLVGLSEKYKIEIIFLLTIIGGVLCGLYVYNAGVNVIYTDYINVVNNYIGNEGGMLVYFKDISIFSHIPIAFLLRWININFFDFNTFFDMYISVIGLALIFFIIAKYAAIEKIKTWQIVIIAIYVFGLNKWEMFLNGTGGIHFWAFVGFIFHFYIQDQIFVKENKSKVMKIANLVLPCLIILFVAGFYCAVYAVVCSFLYIGIIIKDKIQKKVWNKKALYGLTAILIPFIIYTISTLSVGDTRVTSDIPFLTGFLNDPLFFIKFFLMSFGSCIIGIESIASRNISDLIIILAGCIILFGYITSFFGYFYFKLYQTTVLPICMLVSGFLNHAIILYSRWGFQNVTYGMSSRYELQYQSGIIGIFLIFFLIVNKNQLHKKSWKRIEVIVSSGIVGVVILGNLVTNIDEINKIGARHDYWTKTAEIGLNYKNETDESLSIFQIDPSLARKALKTIEEKKLNIFSDRERNKIIESSENNNKTYGIYKDGWVQKEFQFPIEVKSGKLHMELYNPFDNKAGNKSDIFIDGVLQEEILINKENIVIDLPYDNKEVVVTIKSNFLHQLPSPDERKACYLLKNISA